MVSFSLASFLENIHETVDPAYLEAKEANKKGIQFVGFIATATFVASVASAIFGMALTVSSGFGAILGAPIILVSLPIGYASYNAAKVSKNINDIIDNPKEYQKLFGLHQVFDKQKIKKKLEQETFCFSWAVNVVVEAMVKSGYAQ